MPYPIPPWETRTVGELREQFEVERELARRLREASDRRGLYGRVYDEFLQRVPHYRFAQSNLGAQSAVLVALQLRLLDPFLLSRPRFLEVGGAGCGLTVELSRRLPRVIAIEAGSGMIDGVESTRNLEIIVRDTPPYPLTDGCVDLAFSSHLIEHLLPADALLHLREIRRLLAPGGRYVCVTPNRLWGPHDVSRYFSDEPEGLHLREYTHNELLGLMKKAGFRNRRIIAHLGGTGAVIPHIASRALEAALAITPTSFRRRALDVLSRGRTAPMRLLEQVIVIGSC
ncbi:MAG: class I SAM-dependent methyltransferase [Acidobacteriota bacterium]|nr:class I SAM-dependent methyltransferase [Acidobacteriota bacterium]